MESDELRHDVASIRNELGWIRRLLEQVVEQTKKPEPAKTMEREIKRCAVAKLLDGYELTMVMLHPEDWQTLCESLEAHGFRFPREDTDRACFRLNTVAGPVPVYANVAMELGTMHTSCKERAR